MINAIISNASWTVSWAESWIKHNIHFVIWIMSIRKYHNAFDAKTVNELVREWNIALATSTAASKQQRRQMKKSAARHAICYVAHLLFSYIRHFLITIILLGRNGTEKNIWSRAINFNRISVVFLVHLFILIFPWTFLFMLSTLCS